MFDICQIFTFPFPLRWTDNSRGWFHKPASMKILSLFINQIRTHETFKVFGRIFDLQFRMDNLIIFTKLLEQAPDEEVNNDIMTFPSEKKHDSHNIRRRHEQTIVL